LITWSGGNAAKVGGWGRHRGMGGGRGMRIKWYGHACFRIEGDKIAVVTDPYTPEDAGLDPVDEPADVVVMSSATDRFHSCARMVPGDPEVLNALEIAHGGPIEVGGVTFEALPTMESLEHKENPEENALYRFELGGERLAPGGSGQPPRRRAARPVAREGGRPPGLSRGPPTIELDDLDRVIEEIGPRVVVPMHYRIPKLKTDALLLEAFTSRYPQDAVRRVGAAEVELSPDTLPRIPRIYVLEPAG
jgi:L-ascorbate metabolism protein UlaG (beta-lactamase superfamily)